MIRSTDSTPEQSDETFALIPITEENTLPPYEKSVKWTNKLPHLYYAFLKQSGVIATLEILLSLTDKPLWQKTLLLPTTLIVGDWVYRTRSRNYRKGNPATVLGRYRGLLRDDIQKQVNALKPKNQNLTPHEQLLHDEGFHKTLRMAQGLGALCWFGLYNLFYSVTWPILQLGSDWFETDKLRGFGALPLPIFAIASYPFAAFAMASFRLTKERTSGFASFALAYILSPHLLRNAAIDKGTTDPVESEKMLSVLSNRKKKIAAYLIAISAMIFGNIPSNFYGCLNWDSAGRRMLFFTGLDDKEPEDLRPLTDGEVCRFSSGIVVILNTALSICNMTILFSFERTLGSLKDLYHNSPWAFAICAIEALTQAILTFTNTYLGGASFSKLIHLPELMYYVNDVPRDGMPQEAVAVYGMLYAIMCISVVLCTSALEVTSYNETPRLEKQTFDKLLTTLDKTVTDDHDHHLVDNLRNQNATMDEDGNVSCNLPQETAKEFPELFVRQKTFAEHFGKRSSTAAPYYTIKANRFLQFAESANVLPEPKLPDGFVYRDGKVFQEESDPSEGMTISS